MSATRLSGYGLAVNPYVDTPAFRHPVGVNRELLKLLGKRLAEEMDEKAITQNRMRQMAAQLNYKLGQSTVSRILAGKQDVTLGRLSILAECVGVPAWYLLMERDQTEQRVIRPAALPQNVVKLASPYPEMVRRKGDKPVGKEDKPGGKIAARKKR